ncbi:putative rhamnose oligosaccharide ABC transport system, substrate-binding protein component [Rubellimicrobium mesophilum DSM 19309]|uniref:Putative rhamnose oligosaccharide ABC transport system, substrate-binding protein component n=1 Tax=Rubellimicrobium mesophilum DSM 19309 TaxID=442562 RepID=A0A017HM83_9RHOB|nr:extracellular solute-binding protein [Rubellimicrobium mesophilum]EYD75430.1 putative rhamnose oligosaccharide ABC transport system, substrate-binding protein component [Rubellimicrobium mesophilum DSM 19309]
MTRLIPSAALAAALATMAGGAWAQEEEVTLTYLTDGSPDGVAVAEALTEAYTAQHPNVTFDLEQRPGGSDGDNLVKTRLATGEMSDIFAYNAGSLFQALNPTETLEPLDDLPNMAGVLDGFKGVVTGTDGKVYGVPLRAAMGGGIFYNVPMYEELGLKVPQTWEEFEANNEAIKAAGHVPVAQTYGDTWTSQLFVLADYFNVQAEVPDFAEKYTANQAKYADTPAAMRGFEHLQEGFEKGWWNEDFGAATYDDGLRMVAEGEAAHYPMLTFAIGAIQQNYPESLENVGFFAQPGPAGAPNGLTVWYLDAMYVPKGGEHTDIAKDFVNFAASPEACQIMIDTVGATGPLLVEGCDLPADVPRAVSDMLPYFQDGRTAPALEFLSPIKGPALEQITVEVGSGIRPAAEAAALYDQDVQKQAQQLGIEGW